MTSRETSLTAALVAATDELVGFFEISEVSASSLDAQEVVPKVLHRVAQLTRSDALSILVPGGGFELGRTELLSDPAARIDGSGSELGAVHGTKIEALHGGGLGGEMLAIRRDEPFTTHDRKILSVGLRVALSAIETSRLHAASVQAAVQAREREHAAEIAQLALPSAHPELAGLDIHFENHQARDTGGDLVCFHSTGTTVSFAVGDVTGKGLPAAVIMATAASAINAALRDPRRHRPGEAMQQINDWIFDHLAAAEVFLTLFIAEVRPDSGRVDWANAGHHPCLIAGAAGHRLLPPTTPPLGVVRPLSAASRSSVLRDDDVLFVGSDGIVEQTGQGGAMFGVDRLCRSIVGARSARTAGGRLNADLQAFTQGLAQQDDQTMVIVRTTRSVPDA